MLEVALAAIYQWAYNLVLIWFLPIFLFCFLDDYMIHLENKKFLSSQHKKKLYHVPNIIGFIERYGKL